jgi:hypothetical protein
MKTRDKGKNFTRPEENKGYVVIYRDTKVRMTANLLKIT